jgi:RNA polymerase sigma factor (sigma-70 family)
MWRWRTTSVVEAESELAEQVPSPRVREMPLAPATKGPIADFYRAQFRPVVGFLLVIGAPIEEAKDATQEAMIEVARKWQTIDNPKGYVRTCAIRAYVAALNRDRKRDERARRAVSAGDLVTSPDDSYENREWIRSLLAALPPVQRQIAGLVFFDGLEPMEVAQILGGSSATVRSNLRHACENLRRELARLRRESHATSKGGRQS